MIFREATMARWIIQILNVFLVIHVSTSQVAEKRPENYAICEHRDCLTTANAFLVQADFSVDPCVNFYQYACGNFMRTFQPSPETITFGYMDILETVVRHRLKDLLENSKVNPGDIMAEKAKTLYRACINTEYADQQGTVFLEQLLKNAGGWPMLKPPEEFDEEIVNWITVHKYFHQLSGTGSLINVLVYGDPTTDYIPTIHLDQPSTVYGKYDIIDDASLPTYQSFIKDVVLSLVVSGKLPISIETLNRDIADVMRFRKALTLIMSWDDVRRNENRKMNHYTFEEWQQHSDALALENGYNKVNWLQLVDGIFGNMVSLNLLQEIMVNEPEYLDEVLHLISNTPLRTVVNHMYLHFVETHIKYTTSSMRTKIDVLHEQLTGTARIPERWRVCLIENPMQHVISRMYVRKNFGSRSKEIVENIAQNVRLAFLKEISETPWMDRRTKMKALSKIRRIKMIIGYPEFYDNEEEMREYYQHQPVSHDNLLNALGFEQNEFRLHILGLLGRAKHVNDDYPTDTNAYYLPHQNTLQINAAILQWPFFTPNMPSVAVYSGLGTILGHEMGHSLDSIGRYFDENGAITHWWGKRAYETYERKFNCLIQQYNRYAINTDNGLVHLNGNMTLSENIADAIGIQAALDAFIKANKRLPLDPAPKLPGLTNYTDMQMFFLSSANAWCAKINPERVSDAIESWVHSLEPFRVIGSVSNLDEFSEAFNCAPGTPMNPHKKCRLWKLQ